MMRATILCLMVSLCTTLFAQQQSNYLTRPTKIENWNFEQHEAAVLKQEMKDGVLTLTVEKPGTEDWHIQVYQPNLGLKEGEKYTIQFRAKSDAARQYRVYVGTGAEDYHPISPSFDFDATADWKTFSFPFTATNVVAGASRGPLFPLGLSAGTLSLADVAIMGPKSDTVPDAIPAGFFEFPLKWDDLKMGTATDMSFLNVKPAGKNGFITTKDGHFIESATGQRIRFFGANIAAGQAFPTHEDAALFAKQLAKAGVNIVRLHHMDNTWGAGQNVWDWSKPGHQHLDPAQIDKLDYLIYSLKQEGIYVNINLKVSKELNAADGMPESISQVKFTHQKRIDFYYPRMIELQKQYARDLLGHRNPYTKLTYTEDPAVAVVEINNENALLGFWTQTYGKGFEQLPAEFRQELSKQWSAWLGRKYGTEANTQAAWMKDVEVGGKPMLSAGNTWIVENHEPAVASLDATGRGDASAPDAAIDVGAVDGTDWHIQCKLEGLNLKEGKLYTLSFKAHADKPRNVGLAVSKDIDDWHNMGLAETVRLEAADREYTLPFVAHDVAADHARISFSVGGQTGDIWVSNVQLTPGGKGIGLQAGETIAAGNIGIPAVASVQQQKDWISFLVDTEKAYSDTMRSLLKDELKVHANVALTQIDYGGVAGMNREQAMEYADAHAYWQHPSFPNNDWSPTNWTIPNTPQIGVMGERAFGELGNIALARVAGKPYSISEYDHPAPSEYVSEMMLTYSTFACVQDWDIIYTFATGPYGSGEKPDHITGYFDQNNHPAKWCVCPTAALIFREGLIKPAQASATLELPAPMWESYANISAAWNALLPEGPFGYLTRRLQVSDKPLPAGDKPRIVEHGNPKKTDVTLDKQKDGNVYTAGGQDVAAFVGYIGGGSQGSGDVSISVQPFPSNFAAISLVARDAKPLRSSSQILVTVVGQVQNQGIKWNAAHTSIGADWGHGPTIAQLVPATISLKVDGDRKVYLLDATGARVRQVAAKKEGANLVFGITPDDASMLYEITSNQ